MKTAHVAAAVSACNAAISWLPTLEIGLRIFGTSVAIVAGLLAIAVHLHALRKSRREKSDSRR